MADTDRDGFINFLHFLSIMNTMIHGAEEEKNYFSFSLLDQYGHGYFDLQDFIEVMRRFVANYCMLTGNNVKIDENRLKAVFKEMDQKEDGTVDYQEYKQALKQNPQLIEYVNLFEGGVKEHLLQVEETREIKARTLVDA